VSADFSICKTRDEARLQFRGFTVLEIRKVRACKVLKIQRLERRSKISNAICSKCSKLKYRIPNMCEVIDVANLSSETRNLYKSFLDI